MATDYTKIFNTVPYKNIDIHRTQDNKKSYLMPDGRISKTPVSMGDWSSYVTQTNTISTLVLAAIANRDFIGIDIDNSILLEEIYNELNPTQQPTYFALSLPITANKGGHLLYRYTPEAAKQLTQIRRYLKKIKIDIQMGQQLIFLATPANKTKLLKTPPIKKLDDLIPIPQALIDSLIRRALPLILEDNTKVSNTSTAIDIPTQKFGYLLQNDLTPAIVEQLTPRVEYPTITEMDAIPSGHATNWLLQVRYKLQQDSTVSPEVFARTIKYLASLWTTERGPVKQLDSDIKRDIYSIDWKYDEDWKTHGFTFPDYLGNTYEVYNIFEQSMWCLYNTNTREHYIYETQTKAVNAIYGLHRNKRKYKGDHLLKSATIATLVDAPDKPLHFHQASVSSYGTFNIFKPTELLQIIQGYIVPKDTSQPTTILQFLEHLFPDRQNRERLLKFIATKYKTYKHSPLYFVLAGVGGAGKGVFVNELLAPISGDGRLYSADLHKLSNSFNSWMTSSDWLELEEATEGYSIKENERLVGLLKKLTGKEMLTIEKKGKDIGKPQRHYMTPIISTNLNTKLITDTISNDRRLVLFKCANKLTRLTDNTQEFIKQMQSELPQFAYYLSQLPSLSTMDYVDNGAWKNEDYMDYVEMTTTVTDKLYNAASDKNHQYFVEQLIEAGVSKADIDALFSVSISKVARVLVYHTATTRDLNIPSLEDIALDNPHIDSNIRNTLKPFRQRRTHNHPLGTYKINVIEFIGTYKPFERKIEINLPET